MASNHIRFCLNVVFTLFFSVSLVKLEVENVLVFEPKNVRSKQIAILIDWSKRFNDVIDAGEIFDDLKNWIQEFDETTKFVFSDCSTLEVKEYQTGAKVVPYMEELQKQLAQGKISAKGNELEQCLKNLRDERGLPNWLFILSPCAFETYGVDFFGLKTTLICAEGKPWKDNKGENWSIIQENLLRIKNFLLHDYSTYDNFALFLDENYEGSNVEIEHCTITKHVDCIYSEEGKCLKNATYEVKPYKEHRRSRPCGSAPKVSSKNCEDGDCPCTDEKSSLVPATGECTVTCGDGVIYYISLNPTCQNFIVERCSNSPCQSVSKKDVFEKPNVSTTESTTHRRFANSTNTTKRNKLEEIFTTMFQENILTITICSIVFIIVLIVVTIVVCRNLSKTKNLQKKLSSKLPVKEIKQQQKLDLIIHRATNNTLAVQSSIKSSKSKESKKSRSQKIQQNKSSQQKATIAVSPVSSKPSLQKGKSKRPTLSNRKAVSSSTLTSKTSLQKSLPTKSTASHKFQKSSPLKNLLHRKEKLKSVHHQQEKVKNRK